jgi:hypothetical protein
MSAAREQYLPGAAMPAPVLPHDEQAEMGVLGSMMVGGAETIQEMQSVLSDASFYVPRHRTVFWALGALMRAGSPADLITLTHQLRTEEMLEAIGGEVFLTELFTLVPTAAMVSYYAEIVREKFLLREMIAIGTEVVRRAYGAMPAGEEGTNPVQELVDLAQKKFTDLALSRCRNAARCCGQHTRRSRKRLKELEAIYHNRGKHARFGDRLLRTGPNDERTSCRSGDNDRGAAGRREIILRHEHRRERGGGFQDAGAGLHSRDEHGRVDPAPAAVPLENTRCKNCGTG